MMKYMTHPCPTTLGLHKRKFMEAPTNSFYKTLCHIPNPVGI